MPTYPRETVEFLHVIVTVDGSPVVSGVQFAVVPPGARPSGWENPVTIDGKIGIMIEGYSPGQYFVWARVTDSPEIPVTEVGPFYVN